MAGHLRVPDRAQHRHARLFWWYLPEYISRYFERIRDVEHDSDVLIDRVPMLKVVWPHQALKAVELNDVSIVFAFIGQANQKQFESTHRYFRNLALLAKNDIFCQFEGALFIEFIFSPKDAMLAYGDWDGKLETAEASIVGFYDTTVSSPEFTAMVKDFLQIADHMIANNMAPRALTLDVIRAKMTFDVYIRLKAQRAYMEEVAKMKGAKPAIPIDAVEAVDKS